MRNLNHSPVGKFRVTTGPSASSPDDGNFGAFHIPLGNHKTLLSCIVADAPKDDGVEIHQGWEHVSCQALDVHVRRGRKGWRQRVPTWEEMAFLKALFFEDSETVVQFHPAVSDHINLAPCVLHLWRYNRGEFPMPPKALV